MNDWCSCNRLRAAHAEIVKMDNAFYEACEMIADVLGDCPRNHSEHEFDYCDIECSNEIDVATCWMDYFVDIAERRDA